MAKYFDDSKYTAGVEAIATAALDPMDQVNAIKLALGELFDIWPESIRRDRKVEMIGMNYP